MKKEKIVFGFDLGIASVGWAAVRFNDEKNNNIEIFDNKIIEKEEENNQGEILGCGVRCFPVAENPKDGSSLALDRRVKRLARRTCKRRAGRMLAVRSMLLKNKIIDSLNSLHNIIEKQVGGDVWDLRIKGLSEKLSKEELARVLIHIAKHRGFKSYRKAVEEKEKNSEGGKVLKAIRENENKLGNYKTFTQLIVERAGKNGKKRNGNDNYSNSIPREEIEKELDIIYKTQKQYGIFTEKLYEDFKEKFSYYRPIGSIEKMVGRCIFEKEEKRAPKETPTSELFVALTRINNMSVLDIETGEVRNVKQEEREKIIDLLKTRKSVKYKDISKYVFSEKVIFRDLKYGNKSLKKLKSSKQLDFDLNEDTEKQDDVIDKSVEDSKFYEMKGWHQMKGVFKDSEEEWNKIKDNYKLLDKIVSIIACEKNDENITKKLREINISDNYIDKFKKCSFSNFINLSLKALYKIVPHMMDGDFYNEACDKAGYDFKNSIESLVDKNKKGILEAIPQDKLTTVPVVNRTIAQFRKIYNAMVKKFGSPDQINIEAGRDLKNSYNQRRSIEKKNEENKKERESASKKLEELGIKPNGRSTLKYRLYEEQDGKCIYSGKSIDLTKLDEIGYLQVDHILPYSRSLDDSYNNKVLCLTEENQNKGDRTPYEYFKSTTSKNWDDFKARVRLLHNKSKENNLLMENFDEREVDFRSRNANDNSYIAIYAKKYCEDGIDFSQSKITDIKNRVQVRSGGLTAFLRYQWGLEKDREIETHHAQDAIVIACATQGMVQKLAKFSKIKEKYYKGENDVWYKNIKEKLLEPWKNFRNDALSSLNNVFISRPSRKKASGEIHKETIVTINPKNKKYSEKDVISGIKVRGGLAGNGLMLRTDVFSKKNKKGKEQFFLVPIYLSDMGKDLPNKAIVSGKKENEWIEIDESYTFKFSLYMDDLIKTTKEKEEIFGYFRGTDRNTGRITIDKICENKSFEKGFRIGVKTLDKFQKYQVDVLGKYYEIKKETSLVINKSKGNKNGLEDTTNNKTL